MFSDADVLVVLDPGLLKIGYTRNAVVRDDGVIVVNTPSSDLVTRDKFTLEGSARVYTVNATDIAVRNKLIVAGWPVVNTSMLGALSKALGVINVDNMASAVREYFRGKIGEVNAKAVYDAYNETVFYKELHS